MLKKLLKLTAKLDASDLHLVAGAYAQIRLDGDLVALDESFFATLNEAEFESLKELGVLQKEELSSLLESLLSSEELAVLREKRELDTAFWLAKTEFDSTVRFRANFYFAQEAMAAAFRVVKSQIPTLDELKMPSILKKLVSEKSGLILVTGATGSGKSTTLAAMLNEINQTQRKHILTIEDPIEFIHTNAKSLFSQRCVGSDTRSFNEGLKFALRQDPDVILIGELRDAQSMETALNAANTGHLVFASLHTNSAVNSINRIIQSFEGNRQQLIRTMLSQTLLSVISQRLERKEALQNGLETSKVDVRFEGAKGVEQRARARAKRVCLQEILINSPAVANLIREGQIHQIQNAMQLGVKEGMQTMQMAESVAFGKSAAFGEKC